MTLHPVTHLVSAFLVGALVVTADTSTGLLVLLCWITGVLLIPNRTGIRLTGTFLRLLLVAAGFLLVIHGIAWPEFRVSPGGVTMALEHFRHIAAPIAAVLYLSKTIRSEEMFALLIDLRMPPALILIIFRTLWLVPRFMSRIDAVLTAQRLRGMRIESFPARFRAILPTLGPVFSSMLEEISDNALVMTARGFMQPGGKSHLEGLRYGFADICVILTVLTVVGGVWLF